MEERATAWIDSWLLPGTRSVYRFERFPDVNLSLSRGKIINCTGATRCGCAARRETGFVGWKRVSKQEYRRERDGWGTE